MWAGFDRPVPEKVKPIFPIQGWGEYQPKPGGGIWTSSLNSEGESGWIDWCRCEDYGDIDRSSWWQLMVAPENADAKLLVIRHMGDVYNICMRYGPQEGSWYPDTGIDWMAVQRDGYAGVHLTEEGFWSCRMDSMMVYPWDCESTVWFRWVFSEPVLLREGESAMKDDNAMRNIDTEWGGGNDEATAIGEDRDDWTDEQWCEYYNQIEERRHEYEEDLRLMDALSK